jgi:integrase
MCLGKPDGRPSESTSTRGSAPSLAAYCLSCSIAVRILGTTSGQIVRHGHFYENTWQPLLSKAGLPHRKYHATRHSYATWMLDEGADVRWVQAQLGHATIAQTVDTYAHLDTARHASGVEALTRYLTP